jgi:hypothetical protein
MFNACKKTRRFQLLNQDHQSYRLQQLNPREKYFVNETTKSFSFLNL